MSQNFSCEGDTLSEVCLHALVRAFDSGEKALELLNAAKKERKAIYEDDRKPLEPKDNGSPEPESRNGNGKYSKLK